MRYLTLHCKFLHWHHRFPSDLNTSIKVAPSHFTEKISITNFRFSIKLTPGSCIAEFFSPQVKLANLQLANIVPKSLSINQGIAL
jgi:hypothetical protein